MKNIEELRKWNPIANLVNLHSSQGVISFGLRMDDLLNGKYGITFDFDVYLPKFGINLQRPFVWTELQQEELIWSLIYRRTIPPCVVISHEYEHGRKVFQVIDGKQRLMTIQRFIKNEFPIHIDEETVYWGDLDDTAQYHLRNASDVGVVMYYSYYDESITDEQKILLFNFHNFAGTPQEVSHKLMLLEIQKNQIMKELI